MSSEDQERDIRDELRSDQFRADLHAGGDDLPRSLLASDPRTSASMLDDLARTGDVRAQMLLGLPEAG